MRGSAREWATQRVLDCLEDAELDEPFAADELAEVALVLAPIWLGVDATPWAVLDAIDETLFEQVWDPAAVRGAAATPRY